MVHWQKLRQLPGLLSLELIDRKKQILFVSPQEKEFYFHWHSLLLPNTKDRFFRQAANSPVTHRELIHHLAHEWLEEKVPKKKRTSNFYVAAEIVAKNSEILLAQIFFSSPRPAGYLKKSAGFSNGEVKVLSRLNEKYGTRLYERLLKDNVKLFHEMYRWYQNPALIEAKTNLADFKTKLIAPELTLSYENSGSLFLSLLKGNKKISRSLEQETFTLARYFLSRIESEIKKRGL